MRRSGRTTKMVYRAIKDTIEGKAVYIIADNEEHKKIIEILLRETADKLELSDTLYSIKVETSYSCSNMDFVQNRLINTHPICIMMVDHFTHECEITKRENEIRELQRELTLVKNHKNLQESQNEDAYKFLTNLSDEVKERWKMIQRR